MIRQPGYSRQIAPDPKIKIDQILDTGKISKIKKIGHGRQEVRPEQVIPFDDEDYFKDF